MAANDRPQDPSTPRAVAAEAQSREETRPADASSEVAGRAPPVEAPGLNLRYQFGKNVARAAAQPYKREKDDPVYRPLRIYAIDPSASRLAGAIATINVPYERLEPGPVGKRFSVDNEDGELHLKYRRVDLDDAALLIKGGQDPTPSDPRFHQQMVYAVCSNVHAMFKRALGREISWGFERESDEHLLYLQPHAFRKGNAYYDKVEGVLRFGYVEAPRAPATDRTLPGGFIFTCLSHDVIAHELTHAILDGLRANFTVPSGPDVLAFHEAFADLVAIFAHFSYPELVQNAIRESHGNLRKADALAQLAGQLGHGLGRGAALRSAMEEDDASPRLYNPNLESHELGGVLVAAVFEAYLKVFKRKTARLLRLGTGGSAIIPPGELSADLETALARKAAQLAEQFLAIIIRAIDYCPPVDLRYGEFLRALITADCDLTPGDKYGYREALIDAFLRRNIYPRHVSSLSEDALLWRATNKRLDPVVDLDFAHLRFGVHPGSPADAKELHRRAIALGEFATQPDRLSQFGLVDQNDPRLRGCTVGLPQVESIRSARRVGPDGQIVFDVVAEIVQCCVVQKAGNQIGFEVYGGATVILGPEGEIRYSISKSVAGIGRIERRREFIQSKQGGRLWTSKRGTYTPRRQLFQLLHVGPGKA